MLFQSDLYHRESCGDVLQCNVGYPKTSSKSMQRAGIEWSQILSRVMVLCPLGKTICKGFPHSGVNIKDAGKF